MSSTQWFIEPLDYFTNRAIAEALAKEGLIDESEQIGVLDSGGKEHNLWGVPGGKIQALRRAKKSEPRFQFRFWCRSGQNGIIKPADFLEKTKPSSKMKAVLRHLSQVKANKNRRPIAVMTANRVKR